MQANLVRSVIFLRYAVTSTGGPKAFPTYATSTPLERVNSRLRRCCHFSRVEAAPRLCNRITTTTTSTLTAPAVRTSNVIVTQTSRRSFLLPRLFALQRRNFGTTANDAVFRTKERSLSRYSASTIMTPHCKEFRFADYDIIGFDLDGTLLRYNLNEMVPLEYDLLRRFLVEQKGYPRALLDDKTLNRDFLQKGLILDAENGNVLKLSAEAKILRATHGTRLLSAAEIVAQYGEARQWDVSSQFFANPMSTWNGPLATKLRTLLDYFDLAVSLVFAQTIDVLDAQAARPAAGAAYKVWPDILEGLIQMYTRENFANGRSGYFEALRAEPSRYLLRTGDNVVQWLRELRAAGKAIFLLTGSNIDFANFTASYALGADWQQLFDCVVCYAKKPGFFTEQRPYLSVHDLAEVDGSERCINAALPLSGAVYTQGNWAQLHAALAHNLGKTAQTTRSLYVGDNLIQDVYAPVKHRDLDSVAICEELLANEGTGTTGSGGGGQYEFRDVVGSAFWGSYFFLDNEPTLWASIIAQYSQLCIPLMDTVAVSAEKPIAHSFFCENAVGYFPKAPAGLMP